MTAPAAPSKWAIAFTVLVPAFMSVMDVSVVNVALPHMMGTFGINDLSAITWVATSYSIAEVIMVTMTGWWAALIGRRRLFLGSLIVFTLGSILCGTAGSFGLMIFWRVVQGIGGGCLIPLSQATLREAFPPHEQGLAMSVYGMGVVLAPAAGPVLGGWLTDDYGWPWIFYINVPICVLCLALIGANIQDPTDARPGVKRVDWAGIGLLTLAVTGLQVFLERGEAEDWFASSLIVWSAAATLLASAAFVAWELRTPEPIVRFRLLGNAPLAFGSLLALVFGVALFGTTFVLPQFTQGLLGYSAYDSGLVLLPRAMALFVAMPISGWFFDRFDPRGLILFGGLLTVLAYRELAHLSLDSGFWVIVPGLVVMGFGMPFMFVSTSSVALMSVPRPDMTAASSLYTLAQRIGGNVGYALVATLVASRSQFHHARLAEHLTADLPAVQVVQHQAAALALQHGLPAGAAPTLAAELLEATVGRQAAMLAYDDLSWVFGALFVLTVPLVFLLPRPRRGAPAPAAEAH